MVATKKVNATLDFTSGAKITNLPAGSASGDAANVGQLVALFPNGLTLLNDVALPNTVLDILAGSRPDSTLTTMITLGAFTKSVSGSWVAGTGNNGMGVGLTATASTWYHVFAIINAGIADVYFDTSATAANKPASTTSFVRIGSIKLDGSVHILQFIQDGPRFMWNTPYLEYTDVNPGTSAVTKTLVHLPLGVRVRAIISVGFKLTATSDNPGAIYISDLSLADSVPLIPSYANIEDYAGGTQFVANFLVMTNTSQQIRSRVQLSSAGLTLYIVADGWEEISFSNGLAIPQLQSIVNFEFIFNNVGVVLPTGIAGYYEVPFNCTISQVTLLADVSGSVVVDIFKCTYANYAPGTHPVAADKITASAPPTITTALKSQDATLTGWSKNLTAGDILGFNINSATTITQVTVSLKVIRS